MRLTAFLRSCSYDMIFLYYTLLTNKGAKVLHFHSLPLERAVFFVAHIQKSIIFAMFLIPFYRVQNKSLRICSRFVAGSNFFVAFMK